jgi:threonine aldolase
MHLDGARLFNAAVEIARSDALGAGGSARVSANAERGRDLPSAATAAPQPSAKPAHADVVAAARAVCANFDTVSVCLSKGLGAPIGSLVLGSQDTIAKAKRIRKMLGGGMRQAGVIAAAGLHALENHLERLADDHANARRLAQGLREISERPGPLQGRLTVAEPATNILFVDVDSAVGPAFQAYLQASGVAVTGGSYHGGLRQRWVTHLDVDESDVAQALEVVAAYRG